jgi:hypothetical protein
MVPPIYIAKDLGDYKKGNLYLRHGVEVSQDGIWLNIVIGTKIALFYDRNLCDQNLICSGPDSTVIWPQNAWKGR